MENNDTVNNTDQYAQEQNIQLTLPLHVVHLCKMLEVSPKEIILDLIYSIGKSCKKANGDFEEAATEYFLEKGYGQELFTERQIRQMMVGLIALEIVFPSDSEDRDAFRRWQRLSKTYLDLWTLKWQSKKSIPQKVESEESLK